MFEITPKRTLRSWSAGVLAMLLFASAFVMTGSGISPAFAGDNSQLQISKKVDGQDAARDLAPGTTVTYTVNFSVENESVIAPVSITDLLPAAFEGWEILGLSATVNGSATNVSVNLPGVSPATGGTVGAGDANRTIAVDVSRNLSGGDVGMSADDQGLLTYQIKIPENLAPDWYANNQDLVNTATFAAEHLSEESSAIISVDVPVTIDVTPAKTWTPTSQVFEPGASSLVTIGGTQASNVDATTLALVDPADPTLAVDGATSLPADNPFNFVDFDGFTTDPTTNLPSGATSATVDVYYFDGTSWNWTAYDEATMVNANIAGVRTSYSGIIPPGASVSQGYDVVQRATNRSDNSSISTGYTANNTVEATVLVDGKDPLSKEASAELVVTPEQIEVEAGKSFIDPVTGQELTSLTAVGGDTVGVILHARNKAVPNSTTLNSLTVREPGAGADAAYFSEDLAFAGFDNTAPAAAWPAGATNATVKWTLADDSVVEVAIVAGEPLPNPLPGQTVKGFEIVYTGSIAPDALADIKYSIRTNEDLGEANAPAGPFLNVVEVEGSRTGLTPVTDEAEANLTIVAPAIDVTIDKKLSPSIVFPGDDVIVQLPTNATTTGSQTKPTEIIVTDEFTGAGTFWDAYNATEIIAPIQVPTGGTLQIQTRNEAGEWTTFSTLTADSATSIAVPGNPNDVFGIRFIYTKADGFGTSTNVKPNIGFTARETLRESGDTTTPNDSAPFTPTPYENTATANGTGTLGNREVIDDDVATGTGSIRDEDAFGPGPLWAEKDWLDPTTLMSQSGATASSKQRWALNEAGWDRIVLTDPSSPTATGAGTVFEAFNLTRIRLITLEQDPQLQWDSVTAVQLTSDGTAWVDVAAPDGSWMGNNGFKGYSLSGTEQLNTIGVRLIIEENADARTAAAANGDTGAPAVGSGVTSTAAERGYVLDWQLRERARGDDSANPKWITDDAVFNCNVTAPSGGDAGCIDNIFEVRATDLVKPDAAITASDTILLIDGVPNVSLEKTVADEQLIAPQPGDIAQEFYPTTRYTLTAMNASDTEADAAGKMRLSSLRVTDSATNTLGNPAMGTSPFTGRDFASEPNNHFNTFTLTGISFDAFPTTSRIDEDQSLVELWLYSDQDNPEIFSITQIKAGAADALLEDVIGVSVTYQGTDPHLNGNRIVAGDALTMHLDVQLRAEYRVSGNAVTGGPVGSAVRVPNDAAARGQDLIVNPTDEPTDVSDAFVDLTNASIEVLLAKAISVTNTLPGANADTVYEADPQAPVNVTLTATPGDSTAPLKTLTIEDTTAEFWEKFEFVSFGTAALPTDVDQTTQYVFDGSDWVELSAFAGDTSEIVGVRTVYDRADAGFFPLGATSWSSGWGTATMPFTVQLRTDAVIDWANPVAVENLANTTAERSATETASDTADADVDFSGGTNALLVSKRAPNDEGNHQVNPLDSMTWQLIFTNTGSSLLPIEQVADKLPSSLKWNGEQPVFISSGGSGLSSDPAEIAVSPSADGSEVIFEWPFGSRMQPGETMTIEIGMSLQPGLLTGEHATNEVVVTAGDALATCTQPTNNGQDPTVPAEATECSNTNYVEPLVGTYVNGLKTVNGEVIETDGEFLVEGGTMVDSATRLPTGEACDAANWSADDYTRTPCIAYTAVGATDNWKLEYFNIGTNPLEHMTIVDMLPRPGDELLAGYNFSRGSNFRPVIDPATFELLNLPAGAVATIEVTTQIAACYSTGSGNTERWTDDPTCSETALNPANGFWVELDSFLNGGGLAQDIAGFRVILDLQATPLMPGENVLVKFNTINQVIDHTAEGLQPALSDYATPRVAWNQSGVMATDVYGASIPLSKAPPVAGITVKTADLLVSKDIAGDVLYAPETYTVALSCTVPDGLGGRVALDMGAYALLTVPGNLPGTDPADRQSVVVPNVPIGANCEAAEVIDPATGPVVGEFGEIGRSIAPSAGVNPSVDGLSAEIRIRDHGAGSAPTAATLLGFTNTYGVGDLVIEKALRSTSDYSLSSEQLNQSFEFEVVCVAGSAIVERDVTIQAGEQATITDLPVGAECVITETNDRGAVATSSTVGGITIDGTERESVVLNDEGTHILFTNGFVGPTPPDLSETGGSDNTMLFIGIGAGVLVLGGLVLLIARRRKAGSNHDA